MTDLMGVTIASVQLPCPSCLHEPVCRIRPLLGNAPVQVISNADLPPEITVEISAVAIKCDFFLGASIAPPAPIEPAATSESPAPPKKVSIAGSARPLAPEQVRCDPGCNLYFQPGPGIAAHRRMCPEVARFKAERGVTVVPSLTGPAPLPTVSDDFVARREAAARARADQVWAQLHPGEKRPEPRTRVNGDAHAPRSNPDGLSPRQAEVLEALRKDPRPKEAGLSIGMSRGNIGNTLQSIDAKGLLPPEFRHLLPRHLPAKASA